MADLVLFQSRDKGPVVRLKLNAIVTLINSGGAGGGGTGWSPVIAVASDGARRVWQITDWVGGTGTKPATGYVGESGIVANIGDAVDVRGPEGAKGDKGDKGDTGEGEPGSDGWTPIFAAEADGERRVLRVMDWAGGTGTKPAMGYLGSDGIVATKAEAVDVRGPAGSGSVSTVNGKDPDGSGNVSLGISDIPGLEDALDNAGAVVSVNEIEPDSNGNIELDYDDVGAAAANHTHSASDITSGLAAVATSGSYDDLDDKPSIPAAQVPSDWDASAGVARILNKPTIPTLAPLADTPSIASLSGSDTLTPGALGSTAAAAGTISGGTSNTFNWSAAVNYTMALTGNRTLSNPTNVLPGTTRVIVVSSSTSTTRTLAFGSNFVGDLPTVSVTNTSNMVLFLYAVSATKIVVSGVEI